MVVLRAQLSQTKYLRGAVLSRLIRKLIIVKYVQHSKSRLMSTESVPTESFQFKKNYFSIYSTGKMSFENIWINAFCRTNIILMKLYLKNIWKIDKNSISVQSGHISKEMCNVTDVHVK